MKRAVIVSALLALVCGPHVHAQELKTPPADDNGLKIPMMVWVSAVAADQITTYRFASDYRDVLRETNPLISGLDRHPALLVAAGAASDAGTGWAAYRLFGAKHPRIAKAMFYGAAAYRTYLAAHNAALMRSITREVSPASR